jgi:putative aminopeptidase FrvX
MQRGWWMGLLLGARAVVAQPEMAPEMRVLAVLVLVPGMSGHEAGIRDAITARLPRWAQNAARVDAMGNLIVSVGAGEPSVMYVAHMDEIGYSVTNLRDDGYIEVQKHGTFFDRQYEGRVVQIHSTRGPISGVVVIPSNHLRRGLAEGGGGYTVEDVVIDVGTTTRAETEALGIALLDSITVPKAVTALANGRYAARSMDDRFGCAALVSVANRIDPRALQGTLTLAWSAQEEVGLRGAEALAAEFSPDAVIPIDMYATSDSPIESKRLGHAVLGLGPVIRALDASHMAPIDDVRSLLAFAEARGLPLRYGATMGGNDGSMFRNGRSRVIPIGIPIRYSHSAVETIDSRDQVGLVDVLEAMVEDLSWLH